jgi:hypothetical protein
LQIKQALKLQSAKVASLETRVSKSEELPFLSIDVRHGDISLSQADSASVLEQCCWSKIDRVYR